MEKIKFPILIEVVLPKIENKILSLLKDIILVLSFAILTGLSAQIKVEIGPVPITFQTFAVLLAGALLGAKKGAFSQLVYLSFGLTGIPWFARGGGLAYVFSPTFGYIVGFVLCAFLVGFLAEKGFDRDFKKSILAMALGNLAIYLPGLLWLAKFVGPEKVLTIGFYPFIIGDLLKLILAGLLLPISWKIVKIVKGQKIDH